MITINSLDGDDLVRYISDDFSSRTIGIEKTVTRNWVAESTVPIAWI